MDTNSFITAIAKRADKTFLRYSNGATFARVRRGRQPLQAPGFFALQLQTGTHSNRKPVLFSDLQAAKLLSELNETMRPVYAAAMQGEQMPATLCTIDTGPVLRFASPVAPPPLPWQASAQNSHSLPVGIAEDWHGRRVVYWDRRIDAHALIGGATGSGKSVAMRGLLLELAHAIGPAHCEIALVDMKNSGLAPLATLPHVRQPLAWKPADAAALLVAVEDELQRRIASGDDSAPLLVLAVDELTEMLEGDKALQSTFASIARLGREKRIALVGGTQKMLLGELGQGPEQMTFALGGRMRKGDGASLAYPGLFFATSTGRTPEIVQVPYASPEQVAATVASLVARHPTPSPSVLAPGVSPATADERKAVSQWQRAAADAVKLFKAFGDEWGEQTQSSLIVALGLPNASGNNLYRGKERLELVREVWSG